MINVFTGRCDEPPQAQCPSCKRWQDDHDGFGVLSCSCGYCAHAATDGGVCAFCGQRVTQPQDAPR